MTVYDKLVANVNIIHTTGYVLRSKYDTDKSDREKEINDTDQKYLIIVYLVIDLVVTAVLATVDNKILNDNNLSRKKV